MPTSPIRNWKLRLSALQFAIVCWISTSRRPLNGDFELIHRFFDFHDLCLYFSETEIVGDWSLKDKKKPRPTGARAIADGSTSMHWLKPSKTLYRCTFCQWNVLKTQWNMIRFWSSLDGHFFKCISHFYICFPNFLQHTPKRDNPKHLAKVKCGNNVIRVNIFLSGPKMKMVLKMKMVKMKMKTKMKMVPKKHFQNIFTICTKFWQKLPPKAHF